MGGCITVTAVMCVFWPSWVASTNILRPPAFSLFEVTYTHVLVCSIGAKAPTASCRVQHPGLVAPIAVGVLAQQYYITLVLEQPNVIGGK